MSPTEIRRNIKAYAQQGNIQAVEDFDGKWELIIDPEEPRISFEDMTPDRALLMAKHFAS